MKILIAVDHPWPESLNYGIVARIRETLITAGHTVDIIDLHFDEFDPVMRESELSVYKKGGWEDPKVPEYQKRIEDADHLVFVFPVWWDVMPALMKGFFDKVFLPGWAFREDDASPLLTEFHGSTVITTMGAPEVIHTSVEAVLCRGILGFCGIERYRWFNLVDIPNTTRAQREGFLQVLEDYFEKLSDQ